MPLVRLAQTAAETWFVQVQVFTLADACRV
jgi:hypothetical protein